MTKLRWGLLSTARINRALIPPLRASPRNELAAVASRGRERAEAYAREWSIPRAFGSYEDMLADPGIDVIYNPLPNRLHAEWTIKAAQAGKHVLCEKPLAMTVEEVDAMAAAAQQAGVVVAEAFMYRHHPQTLKVKEMVERGEIGDLRLVRGSFTFNLTHPGDVRLDPALGGGSLRDVGCYPISYARYVIGADGTASIVRKWLYPDLKVTYSQAAQEIYATDVELPRDAMNLLLFPEFAPFYFDVLRKDGLLLMECDLISDADRR